MIKKLLSSWKFYIVVICLGFALWAVPELVDLLRPLPPRPFNKSIPFMMVEPSRGLYQEAKEWGKVIGQVLTGLGGVGGAVKILVDLFRPRKRR
jgi:hypothetical protein